MQQLSTTPGDIHKEPGHWAQRASPKDWASGKRCATRRNTWNVRLQQGLCCCECFCRWQAPWYRMPLHMVGGLCGVWSVETFRHPCAVLDESAQTLFLTEMWRGLSYTLKSFFDPKVTVHRLSGMEFLLPSSAPLLTNTASVRRPQQTEFFCQLTYCRSTTPLRRGRSVRASGGSTCCGDTPPARSGASPASCARRCVFFWFFKGHDTPASDSWSEILTPHGTRFQLLW